MKKVVTKGETLFLALLGVGSTLTRWPFLSRYPFYVDSANYTEAIFNFNPVAHRPHPPGAIGYVYLGKLIDWFVHDPHLSLLLISIISGSLAAIAIYFLGREFFSKPASGIIAAGFTTAPLVWFNSSIVLPHTLDVFLVTLFLIFAVRCLKRERGDNLLRATIFLGLVAAVRPTSALFLLPLYIWILAKYKVGVIIRNVLLFLILNLAWLIPTVVLSGGASLYWAALQRQFWGVAGSGNGLPWGAALAHNLGEVLLGVAGGLLGLFLVVLIFHFWPKVPVKKNASALWLDQSQTRLSLRVVRIFMILSVLPASAFFLLGHTGTGNYIMFLLPIGLIALFLALLRLAKKTDLSVRAALSLMAAILILANLAIFWLDITPFSAAALTGAEKYRQQVTKIVAKFDPADTVLLTYNNLEHAAPQMAQIFPDRTICNVTPDPTLLRLENGAVQCYVNGQVEDRDEADFLGGMEKVLFIQDCLGEELFKEIPSAQGIDWEIINQNGCRWFTADSQSILP